MISNIRIQRNIAFLAIILFIIKIIAWWYTQSLAIYSDALESIVNIVAGFIGWYSLWLAAKPRDLNHPYGHGKAEYISSAIEGTLMSVAALIIIIEAIEKFLNPHEIKQINEGLLLMASTAVINFIVGRYAIVTGRRNKSIALESSGKHLQSDTITTIGVIVALAIISITHIYWLDPLIACIFACIILVSGYKVIRKSLSGIMDEADFDLLKNIIEFLNQNRRPQWIDLHNLRMIQYGNTLHLDGHLTLPWYYNVEEAHREVKELNSLIQQQYGDKVEIFIHVDGCTPPSSCQICNLENCPERKLPFKEAIKWDIDNVLIDKRHSLK